MDDFIGRCIAEQLTSRRTLALTLTYAGTTVNSVVLVYRDVQNFLKSLRNHGYRVRYVCAGEYGALKGRAHWHLILFFSGDKLPQVLIGSRIEWGHWPHGLVYFQEPDYGGFKYLMKYALKSYHQSSVRNFTLSKKPPIGSLFFDQLASDIAAQGLALHDARYSFSHVVKRFPDGEYRPREFMLQGVVRKQFIERYLEEYRFLWRKEPAGTDFLYESYFDPIARGQLDGDPERFARELAARPHGRDRYDPRERRCLGYLVTEFPVGLVVAWSDFSATFSIEGEPKWQIRDVGASGDALELQLQMLPLGRGEREACGAWLRQKFREERQAVAESFAL